MILLDKIMENIIQLKRQGNIREIYLFGSVARGDQDEQSDVDILIVIDNCSEDDYIKYKKEYASILQIPVSWISLYREKKILKMHEKGSYFLWHLKQEGKVLYSRENELDKLFATLPRYRGMKDDIKEYRQILDDVNEELHNVYLCIEYELSVLASLVRNTCIMLSYLNNRFDFSRNQVVKYCIDTYKIDVSLEEYRALYQYRSYETGKIQRVEKGKIEDINKWVKVENQLLDISEKEVDDYEKKSDSGVE